MVKFADKKRNASYYNTLFCKACAQGHLEIVKYFHKKGVNIECYDNDPIQCACIQGRLEVVKYLHQNGVDIRTHDDLPFLQACANNHLDVAEYLYQNGDIVITDNDLLVHAYKNKRTDVIEYLEQFIKN